MADLKTTNIFGDAYINNKVGIATNAPATRLQIGQLSPTAATEGIQFGDDPGTRVYRSAAGILTYSGSIEISANGSLNGNYGTWTGEINKIQWHSNNLYFVNRGGGSWLFRNSGGSNVFSVDTNGGTSVSGYLSAATYVYATTYLQTNGNLIYPSGYSATQTLQVGNSANNAWIAGISIAPGGNVTVFNDLTANGNTYLGNANGDTVYVNDTIRIGATDSGDASLFFGEGSVAGSDYGARWYWDSGYTFTWYTRNAGTDTALFDYVTNDTNYINWRRHFHMQNKEINYNAQIHFNAGTRFVGNNTNYLNFRSDATNAGGILVQDGNAATKGYTGYWDSSGGGILNNTGNWSVRYNFGNANSGGTLFGDWTAANLSATGYTMTNLTGAYQNTTVYDSAKTQSATPSRGIRAPASSIQFTDSYAIAPFYTYRSTGDWPVPYGIGWGTGGESSGIFQRYASNGSSFGDMIFYTGNDGYGAFSFRRHTWEGTAHFAAGSGELSTELFRVDWAGNLTMLGALNGSANSATFYANNGSYGAWAINGTRNGWGGIEFANNGVSLMMGSDTVGFHQNTNGWLFRVHNGSGFIYKGSWGGGTAATILDSSNQAYAWAMNQNVTTTSSPTFSELTLSGTGIGAYGFVKYGGIRNGNWQTFTDSAGEMNIIQTNNITDGNHSNYPTGVYGYGAVLSWRTSNHSFQLYAAHTGDLAYKTQWDNDNYSGWRRILDSTNYVHAANMNQYVRTTDNPTFGTVTAALSGNATTATTLQTARAINGVNFNGSAAITVNGLNYNVNNEWLRENGDDAHFQMYGNSRTMIYRTDGNTNTHGGGAYAHIFYYGGSADANRMFIINTDGRLWSNYHGWLDTMSTTGNAATATSAGCVNSDTGNVGGSRLQYWQTSGNTALNPDGEWYNAIRMGHGDPVTYYSNTLAVRMTGGNLGDIYTRTTTNGATGSWNRFWHNNNDGAGSGLDADLVDGKGLAIAGTADTIVLRDSSGHITGQYILGSYFNASAGNNENPTIGQIWTQNTTDNYLRKSTPAHFRSQVTDGSYPSLTGANASGTWSISVTGNAATATLATKASTLSQGGGNGTGMTFNWSGQSGQPTWLWGSNDGTNIYVWNPSNFNVNSATTATTANALNTSNSYTIAGLTSNGTISIFPSYVSPYSSFLRMGYDNSGNYEYTIKRDGTTGFLEFYNTQANYTGYYFRVNGSGGGLGIAVSPASRLHVNGDGTNPAVRVDNTGVVLAASVGSNGRTFYGWLPISVDGATRWIRIFS